MSETTIYDPREILPNRVAGYVWEEGRIRNAPFVERTLHRNADAGLDSTILNLSNWEIALHGDSLLNAKSRAAMWTGVRLNDGSTRPFGFGWQIEDVNGHRLLFHDGNRPDSSSFVGTFPEDKLTVIVLTNLSSANPGHIARSIAAMLVPALTPVRSIPDTDPAITKMVKQMLV